MRAHILFLTQSGPRGASSRYRVYQFVPSLQEAGFDVRVLCRATPTGRGVGRLWGNVKEEAEILRAARGADLVFVQKRLFRTNFVKRLRAGSRRLVFDFDDAIFTSPEGTWSNSTRRRVGKRLDAILGNADMTIAGNGFLAEYARVRTQRVEVLPTVIDIGKYATKKHRDSGAPVIGWIGNSVNHRYLDALSDILPGVSNAIPNSRLLVVSDKDYAMSGMKVENRRWSEQSEAGDLLDMDVGIMPLDDDEWTRGKCALKALQYMAAGLPVVCSAVGANREVVTDGVDGYLASRPDDWRDALAALLTSLDRRSRMGRAGREKAEAQYSIDACVPRLVALLRSALAGQG